MDPVLRLTRPTDIGVLTNLDTKAYHYPLALEAWQEAVKGSGKKGEARIVVAELGKKAVAYGMWSIDTKKNEVVLDRLGVLPEYRLSGLGKLFILACMEFANKEMCDTIKITVPDLHCQPEDPDDVSVFLNRMGFKTTGKCIDDWKIMYGEMREGYEFTKPVHFTSRKI